VGDICDVDVDPAIQRLCSNATVYRYPTTLLQAGYCRQAIAGRLWQAGRQAGRQTDRQAGRQADGNLCAWGETKDIERHWVL